MTHSTRAAQHAQTAERIAVQVRQSITLESDPLVVNLAQAIEELVKAIQALNR